MTLFPWLICWWRGHTSPGEYGWQFLQGNFEVWCDVCGEPVRLGRDNIRPGPKTIFWVDKKEPSIFQEQPMAQTFAAKPEAQVEAMADHFAVLQAVGWNAEVRGAVQQVTDYFNGIGSLVPWAKIIAILAPVAIKIWSGQAASIDWVAVVAALIALIPGPVPPVIDPLIP